MHVIGVTGSIAAGKSTIGAMLETLGVPVHEADHAVSELLMPGSKAYQSVCAAFPYFSYPDLYTRRKYRGARFLKKDKLGALVFKDEEKRQELENILHPYVREHQQAFLRQHKRARTDLVALDIPLLFETGAEMRVDSTLTVSVPPHVQASRVYARPHMNDEKFTAILARQMPDKEKQARADYVVHTGLGHAYAFRRLKDIITTLRQTGNKR